MILLLNNFKYCLVEKEKIAWELSDAKQLCIMLELKIHDSHESKFLLESELAKLKSKLDRSNSYSKSFTLVVD